LITQQSPLPSPPPNINININISPGSPPLSPKENHIQAEQSADSGICDEEKQNLMGTPTSTNHPATINEELEEGAKNKSSLSLPFESGPSVTTPANTTATTLIANNHALQSNGNATGNHTTTPSALKPSVCERSQSDRRKLSVSNIMSFGEQRRRSTSSIFSDMRKMSITNFDSLKSPGIGEISPSIFVFLSYYFRIMFSSPRANPLPSFIRTPS
jgi:hypothetical protein